MTDFCSENARFEVLDLGCWRDTNDRALTSLESQHPALMDSYWLRVDPYDKCLRATIVFGIEYDIKFFG